MNYGKFNDYWKALNACHNNVINLTKEREQRRKEENSDMEAFIEDQLQKEFRRMDDLYHTLRHIEENDIFLSS
ncbi:MAG: hypothetical protein IJ642_02110 [Oscillospiraceae bacterium]|nr:hypothetical protein [Oscillospiraceae bacterium]